MSSDSLVGITGHLVVNKLICHLEQTTLLVLFFLKFKELGHVVKSSI